MNKLLIVIALIIVTVAAAPTENELKLIDDAYTKAIKAIDGLLDFLKTEYIEDLSAIIKKGCEKLHDDTVQLMIRETDGDKRVQSVRFAIDSYKRLEVFLDEVKRSIE